MLVIILALLIGLDRHGIVTVGDAGLGRRPLEGLRTVSKLNNLRV